jgi:hypothetical protein
MSASPEGRKEEKGLKPLFLKKKKKNQTTTNENLNLNFTQTFAYLQFFEAKCYFSIHSNLK